MVRIVDWKMSPRACDERCSLATFHRKWGRIGKLRSTTRMAGVLYTDFVEEAADDRLDLGAVAAVGKMRAARHHVQPGAGDRRRHAARQLDRRKAILAAGDDLH